MKTLVASLLVSAAMAAGAMVAPALAQEAKKTELVNAKGETVDSLLLRYAFDATWVIDSQRILVRDAHRDHYLVTLKEKCDALDLDRDFKFFPVLHDRIRSSLNYEVRNPVGPICDIGKVAFVSDGAAKDLRAELANDKKG
jgi:hypothetical protein